jgi:hypothetical protein
MPLPVGLPMPEHCQVIASPSAVTERPWPVPSSTPGAFMRQV